MNGTLALLTAAVSGLLSKQCSWLLAVLSQHPRVIKHYTGPAGPRHTGLHRVSATTTPCRMQGLGSVTQACTGCPPPQHPVGCRVLRLGSVTQSTGCPPRQHPVGSVSAGVTVSSSCLCLLEHMSAVRNNIVAGHGGNWSLGFLNFSTHYLYCTSTFAICWRIY